MILFLHDYPTMSLLPLLSYTISSLFLWHTIDSAHFAPFSPFSMREFAALRAFVIVVTTSSTVWSSESTSTPSGAFMDKPQLECQSSGIRLHLNPINPFNGHVYVRGFFADKRCHIDYGDRLMTSPFYVDIPYLGECSVTKQRSADPPGIMFSVVVIAQKHRILVTQGDRAFRLNCFYRQSETLLQHNLDVSDLPPSPLDTPTALPPSCHYDVLSSSMNGPKIRTATVGQPVVHRWACDSKTNGFLVHSCKVRDPTGGEYQLIDERGCVTDGSLLSPLTYSDNLSVVFTTIPAFRFADQLLVMFTCQITICEKAEDGCEGIAPPQCEQISHDLPIKTEYKKARPVENETSKDLVPVTEDSSIDHRKDGEEVYKVNKDRIELNEDEEKKRKEEEDRKVLKERLLKSWTDENDDDDEDHRLNLMNHSEDNNATTTDISTMTTILPSTTTETTSESTRDTTTETTSESTRDTTTETTSESSRDTTTETITYTPITITSYETTTEEPMTEMTYATFSLSSAPTTTPQPEEMTTTVELTSVLTTEMITSTSTLEPSTLSTPEETERQLSAETTTESKEGIVDATSRMDGSIDEENDDRIEDMATTTQEDITTTELIIEQSQSGQNNLSYSTNEDTSPAPSNSSSSSSSLSDSSSNGSSNSSSSSYLSSPNAPYSSIPSYSSEHVAKTMKAGPNTGMYDTSMGMNQDKSNTRPHERTNAAVVRSTQVVSENRESPLRIVESERRNHRKAASQFSIDSPSERILSPIVPIITAPIDPLPVDHPVRMAQWTRPVWESFPAPQRATVFRMNQRLKRDNEEKRIKKNAHLTFDVHANEILVLTDEEVALQREQDRSNQVESRNLRQVSHDTRQSENRSLNETLSSRVQSGEDKDGCVRSVIIPVTIIIIIAIIVQVLTCSVLFSQRKRHTTQLKQLMSVHYS